MYKELLYVGMNIWHVMLKFFYNKPFKTRVLGTKWIVVGKYASFERAV